MAFLTIEQRAGKRGHGWEAAGTKAAQEEGIARKRMTARGRSCPRWCSLSVPGGPAGARGLGRQDGRSAYASTVSPLRAASIAATSIFFMGIIASNARLAAAVSGLVVASSRTRGVICQEKPHRSLHQPQALSSPPLST